MRTLLTNPFLWSCVVSSALLVRAALTHMASINALANYINTYCPELWANIGWRPTRGLDMLEPWKFENSRLVQLVFFNAAASHQPTDTQFHNLLRRARLSALTCFVLFAIAIVSLGVASPHLPLDFARSS